MSGSKADDAMGGVAAPGNTSERAMSGTLVTFTPGVSAVEMGVEFLTASMPEAEPEKLSRILTGVLASDGTLLEIVPLKVISPVEASLVTALSEPLSYSDAERSMVIARNEVLPVRLTSTSAYAALDSNAPDRRVSRVLVFFI